jgi:alpha-1,2-mannosyltransferase
MGFLLRLLYLGFINTLLASISTFFLCKWLVGWHLQRSTAARRELILARIGVEEQDYHSKIRHSPKSDDGDWEKVESYASGSAPDGGKLQENWKGVVGFFHPFW